MRKILLLILALMAILPASADRYVTFGINDTLRIRPSSLGGEHGVAIRAHFDGRLDKWDMTMSLPQGMHLQSANRGTDMLAIPYDNYQGIPSYCSAQFFYDENVDYNTLTFRDSLTASIIVPGYWDPNNDGIYETYGNVKWEAGDYAQMCNLVFSISANFPDTASILINEHLSSTMDLRGFTIPNTYITNKIIFVYVGYMRGDVDGNEIINIGDVTLLIDYIMGIEDLDYYQLKAADVDGDGNVGVVDVTVLTDMVFDANGLEDPTI